MARASRGSRKASPIAPFERQMRRKRAARAEWNSASQLPGRAGRTRLRSATPPQSEAAVTRAVMRGEADKNGIAAIFLTHQLAYVQLAALPHLGCTGVPEVRIMKVSFVMVAHG